MAHQQHGAGKFHKAFFEKLQRFDVQIVGGLIEHEQVHRPAEQRGEHGPVLLAAGQRAQRHAQALWRKQKIAQIGHGMALAAADLHKLPALANVVDKIFFGVQL